MQKKSNFKRFKLVYYSILFRLNFYNYFVHIIKVHSNMSGVILKILKKYNFITQTDHDSKIIITQSGYVLYETKFLDSFLIIIK